MLNWLHFTDLHCGLVGQSTLWPNVRQAFFDDLERLRKKCGPWQLVFFTGDLVQKGSKGEFDRLDRDILKPLWDHFNKLGCNPLLLAVPGNHDLIRPIKGSSAVDYLLHSDLFHEIADKVFDDPHSEYKKVIDSAFLNYDNWNKTRCSSTGFHIEFGLLPGDFSVTIKADNHQIGIIGLNTTFLQLDGGDFRGKLVCDQRQLNAVCGGDGPAWAKKHDACLLLTHQGPQWLNGNALRTFMAEINPQGMFAVHLFGHEHELELESRALAGGKVRNAWQGTSLFGLEKFGEPPKIDRRHGYSAGRLDFWEGNTTLQLWPRKAVNHEGWLFIPDYENCVLDEDNGGTKPVEVHWNRVRRGADSPEMALQMVNLAKAQEDLIIQLKQLDEDETVEVQHIGLDMHEARSNLVAMLENDFYVANGTLKLLVMTGELNELNGHSVPVSVRKMTEQVTRAVETIIVSLDEALDDQFRQQGKRLKIEIRSYAELPTSIHGFSLLASHNEKKQRRIATYYSFCRWSQKRDDLEWGGRNYRRILGEPDNRDPSSRDIMEIFKGAFVHLWDNYSKPWPGTPFVIGQQETSAQ